MSPALIDLFPAVLHRYESHGSIGVIHTWTPRLKCGIPWKDAVHSFLQISYNFSNYLNPTLPQTLYLLLFSPCIGVLFPAGLIVGVGDNEGFVVLGTQFWNSQFLLAQAFHEPKFWTHHRLSMLLFLLHELGLVVAQRLKPPLRGIASSFPCLCPDVLMSVLWSWLQRRIWICTKLNNCLSFPIMRCAPLSNCAIDMEYGPCRCGSCFRWIILGIRYKDGNRG